MTYNIQTQKERHYLCDWQNDDSNKTQISSKGINQSQIENQILSMTQQLFLNKET